MVEVEFCIRESNGKIDGSDKYISLRKRNIKKGKQKQKQMYLIIARKLRDVV